MPIKDIDAPVAKAKKSKGEMPIVAATLDCTIVDSEGKESIRQLVTEFNKARADYKAAEARVKQFDPLVKEFGVKEWLRANVNNSSGEPITSIKLVDRNGSEVRLTGMNKYSTADSEPVENLFENVLEEDANEFVQFTVKASFDSSVFLDKDGNFSEATYLVFKKAIDDVAAKLKVKSPLESVKVLVPKPDFHTKRWSKFNLAQQGKIFEVLPNQITLTPGATFEPPAVEPALEEGQ